MLPIGIWSVDHWVPAVWVPATPPVKPVYRQLPVSGQDRDPPLGRGWAPADQVRPPSVLR